MTLAAILDGTGRVVKRPPFWAATAGVLAVAGGEQGKKAAMRGGVCYASAAIAANVFIKPFTRRRQPKDAGPEPFRSGHAAADTAFAVGACQEQQSLAVLMAVLTIASHWSLVRSSDRFPVDVVAGDLLGVGMALWIKSMWPTRSAIVSARGATPRPGVVRYNPGS